MEEISIIGAKEREIEALIGVFKRSDLLDSLRVKSLLNFDFKKRR